MAYYAPYQNQYYTQLAQTYNPVQVPQNNVTPVQQNNNGIIWIQGENSAKSFMVAPNTTVLLMDSEAQKFYLKSSDASGMPLPLRVFEYTETTQNASNTASEAKEVDLSGFATKAELDAFRDEIHGILKNVPRQINRRSEREVEADA